MSSIVPILFRLLNFGIIVFAGIYVYRRYGRALLQEMFEQHQEQQAALKERSVTLASQAHELENAFTEQQKLAQRLENNVAQWRSSVTHALLLRKQEKEALSHVLQRKAERVARYTAWISIKRDILDDAVKEATQKLSALYADQARGKMYLNSVLSELKERQ